MVVGLVLLFPKDESAQSFTDTMNTLSEWIRITRIRISREACFTPQTSEIKISLMVLFKIRKRTLKHIWNTTE